jgi:two-component system response regulator AtoC
MMVMDRALLVSQGALTGTHLAACLRPTGWGGGAPAPPPRPSAPSAPAAPEPPPPPSSPPRRDDADLRQRIVAALEQCAGNQSRAAELLGISRRTLLHRMDELDLPRPRKR